MKTSYSFILSILILFAASAAFAEDTEPGFRNSLDRFFYVYPRVVRDVIESNTWNPEPLPHPTESDTFLSRVNRAGRILRKYSIKRTEYSELVQNVISAWSWYWDESQTQKIIDEIEEELPDYKLALDTGAGADTIDLREKRRHVSDVERVALGRQRVTAARARIKIKMLKAHPHRPPNNIIKAVESSSDRLLQVLKDAEHAVHTHNHNISIKYNK